MNVQNQTIFEGDNLYILRGLDSASIDLIYHRRTHGTGVRPEKQSRRRSFLTLPMHSTQHRKPTNEEHTRSGNSLESDSETDNAHEYGQ